MDKIEKNKIYEKKIVKEMIYIYCRKHNNTFIRRFLFKKHIGNEFFHNKDNGDYLCDDFTEVLEYVFDRIDNCKFIEEKTFCSNCKSCCYSPKMRNKIRDIMKFSGKRMLFRHPILTLKHLYFMIKGKKRRNLIDKEKIG